MDAWRKKENQESEIRQERRMAKGFENAAAVGLAVALEKAEKALP